MNVVYIENGQDLLIKLKGELDHHSATECKKIIDEKLTSGKINNLTIDVKGLDFIDSSAIGFIIGRYKVLKKNEGNLDIINTSHKLKKVLDMSGIGKIIKIK
ncbi:anti-sigma factor antagonist [Sedimentibacter sp. zth1]|uniref:anti-sigma factor antagonist n=1 Tax=Sedimentibacter sp. zth1 TaxID=2816908 RepID=UPI001A9104AB|nr:anti-sigma factor antagonist [Sedimentibacter sp. zth1]QSX06386.1 anti-sigma factor antagonist [Sedimentibacter sp. zth1]